MPTQTVEAKTTFFVVNPSLTKPCGFGHKHHITKKRWIEFIEDYISVGALPEGVLNRKGNENSNAQWQLQDIIFWLTGYINT